tara:strand:+ start:973 stop:2142 length:1170 start_codon:yes stop_codon:yes gene_type:complete
MKIALVLSSPPGYSETFFRSKVKGLKEEGHQILLVTAATKEKFNGCEHRFHTTVSKNTWVQIFQVLLVGITLLPFVTHVVRYIRLERKVGTSFKRCIEKTYLNATLLKLRVDWIHFGFATMAVDRELIAKAIGAQMAVSFRGFDVNVYPIKHPNAYQMLWNQVDKVHSISKFLLEKAYALGLPKETPFKIITPAVAMQNIPERKVSKNHTSVKITTVARLHYIKGIDVLLETASLLSKNNIDFIWEVIGAGTKKDTERYLYHRYQLGLENNVLFVGKQAHQEAVSAIANSDVYVQTSLMEGFCNAVLEAQACGIIPIAFATGGLSENIENNQTGFLVNQISADALSSKIIKVLSLKKKEKKNISQQAIVRVRKEFTIEKQQQEFVDFYS